jgi:hypothetical protein
VSSESQAKSSENPLRIDPAHAWLAAVLPAQTKSVRVHDAELAAALAVAGAELVGPGAEADIEIGPLDRIEGHAAVLAVPLVARSRSALDRHGATRAGRRVLGSPRLRLEARRAMRELRAKGPGGTSLLLWDVEQVLRLPWTSTGPRRLAERFPLHAVAVGHPMPPPATLLEAALEHAGATFGTAGTARAASWGILVIGDAGVARIAVGPARRLLDRQRTALEVLPRCLPDHAARLVPTILHADRLGLSDVLLEQRLPGNPLDSPPLGALLDECLDFLAALHAAGDAARNAEPSPSQHAETIAAVCDARTASQVLGLGRAAEQRTKRLHPAFTHGDFGHANLLVDHGRLAGVVDWNKAAPARVPLLDLLNLLVTSEGARSGSGFADAFTRYLFPLVQAGGDERLRAFCHRVGIEPSSELLEGLAIAYWLERYGSQLRTYADRAHRPAWLEENIVRVVAALPAI